MKNRTKAAQNPLKFYTRNKFHVFFEKIIIIIIKKKKNLVHIYSRHCTNRNRSFVVRIKKISPHELRETYEQKI